MTRARDWCPKIPPPKCISYPPCRPGASVDLGFGLPVLNGRPVNACTLGKFALAPSHLSPRILQVSARHCLFIRRWRAARFQQPSQQNLASARR